MTNKAKQSLPNHFEYEYPKFVRFIELYFEWKDRDGGMSHDEVQVAIDELGIEGTDHSLSTSSGNISSNMLRDHSLERTFGSLITSDNQVIVTSDNREISVSGISEEHTDKWYEDVGFPIDVVRESGVDVVLFLKLIRHIGAIRGTAHATRLFFKMFFNEEVTITYPRDQIAIIDDNFILDHNNSNLRDDHYYNEYTYVIKVSRDPNHYTGLFNTIYWQFFHAAGFNPIVEKDVSEITVPMYIRSATVPDIPTGGSYNFADSIVTAPTGWSDSVPTGSDDLYFAAASFKIDGSTGTDDSPSYNFGVEKV